MIWLSAAILVACTIFVVIRTRPSLEPTGGTPDGGETSGALITYFDKIDELSGHRYDGYFVTALDQTQKHLVQVSAKRQADGTWRYQFDVPVMKWSKGFIPRIRQEAEELGYEPVIHKTSNGLETFDIFFDNREDHADFVRWVVQDIYGHEDRRTYDITWG